MPVRRSEQLEKRRRRELLRALLEEEESEYEEPLALEQELLAMVRDLRRKGRRPGLGGLMSSEQLQGFMWGLGVATLLLMLLPSAKQTLRPFAVSVVKGALDLADQVKGLFGEAGEGLQDLFAEAQFDRLKREKPGDP